ncbi:MAG: glycosyltransferase family 87 protein [Ktedonobacterales bacterium]
MQRLLFTTHRRTAVQDRPAEGPLNRLAPVLTPVLTPVLAPSAPSCEAPDPGVPPRLGAIVCGSGALGLASLGYLPFGPGIGTPLRGILTVGLASAGLLLLIASFLSWPLPPAWQRVVGRLRSGVMALTFVFCVVTLLGLAYFSYLAFVAPSGYAYDSDMLALTHVNAELMLSGQNPYTTNAGFQEALVRFPSFLATPLRGPVFGTGFDPPSPTRIADVQQQYVRSPESVSGAFDPRTLHSYPALSFLVYVPVLWAGLPNILPLQLFVYLLLFAWLVWKMPPSIRWWGALTALAAAPVVLASLIESNELMCVALLVLAWEYRRRRWLGAVLLGLACAYKQYAWGFVPFFAVDTVLAEGWLEAIWRGVITLGAFLLPNAPFLVESPLAWFTSLWLPVSEPLFPQGMGVIALSLGHLLPYGPPALYALLEVAAMGVMLFVAIRWRVQVGAGVLVLALVPLFFAFRSIPSYFAFAPWLALYAVMCRAKWNGRAASRPLPSEHHGEAVTTPA